MIKEIIRLIAGILTEGAKFLGSVSIVVLLGTIFYGEITVNGSTTTVIVALGLILYAIINILNEYIDKTE